MSWTSSELICAPRSSLTDSNLGLTKLSTRIADLGDLVTFQNTFSPRASMASSTRVVSEAPRFPTLSLSDSMRALPTGRLAGNRPFARVSSAPAAMAHTGPGTSANRVASGLCTRFSIPPNHNDILEELSQSGSLLSSPTITPPPARSGFSRSKTGAVRIAVSPNDGPNHTALEIMAARNCLARCESWAPVTLTSPVYLQRCLSCPI